MPVSPTPRPAAPRPGFLIRGGRIIGVLLQGPPPAASPPPPNSFGSGKLGGGIILPQNPPAQVLPEPQPGTVGLLEVPDFRRPSGQRPSDP